MKINRKFYRGFVVLIGLLLFLPFNNCSNGFRAISSVNKSATLGSNGTPVGPVTPGQPTPALPAVPAGKVQVFMAAGKIARTVISCDDGATWIKDRSDNDAARCWTTGDPNYVECDHDPRSFTGLDASNDGWFYTQFGWGFDGTVRRSRNGVTWETIRTGGWGGGLAVAFNQVVSEFEYNMQISKDQGTSFKPPTTGYGNFDHAFLSRAGNKIFSKGRGDGQLAVSLDGGDTWKSATAFTSFWGGNGFAEGNGMLVTVGTRSTAGQPDNGFASRSLDNGVTWTAVQVIPDSGWSMAVQFNGTEFVAWGGGKTWKSTDAITWTSTPMTVDGNPAPYWSGAVSRNPQTGTFVSIIGNWGSWYANQGAIRSNDGITWTSLDANHFKGGHPIGKIVSAEMDASACGK